MSIKNRIAKHLGTVDAVKGGELVFLDFAGRISIGRVLCLNFAHGVCIVTVSEDDGEPREVVWEQPWSTNWPREVFS